MKPIDLTALTQILQGQCHTLDKTASCRGVSIDTRSLEPGDLYVAIRGERFDGHNFAQQALLQGAVGCLVDHPIEKIGPQIVVQDTITALGQWARWSRQNQPASVIGITGSVGKTTTRQMIYHVLRHQRRCWQSPKNFNNFIGLPLTLLSAPRHTEIIIAELGTNQPGEIAHLAKIAEPDLALVTYAAPAHLEGLGSLDAIVKEKLSIREGLRANGKLILNADCPPLWREARGALSYGLHPEATVRGSQVTYTANGSTLRIDGQDVTIRLPGPGNVQNALACWAVCRELEMAPSTIAEALACLPPLSMRGECLKLGTLTVINDCYNANPASMTNALKTLALLDPDQQRRRIFVCGHMGELGSQAEKLHCELGQTIAETQVDLVIAVGTLAAIAAQAAQTLRPETQICRYKNVEDAKASLGCHIKEQDLILVKGSRSAHLEHIVTTLKETVRSSLTINSQ